MSTTEKYARLANVLDKAYDSASIGKGAQRHANDKAFEDQPMQSIMEAVGTGFATGQIIKKVSELKNLPDDQARINEMLDVIVYACGVIIFLEE